MAKKVQQQYAKFKTTTPKLESYYHNLVEPDSYNDKYDIGVVVDDTPECQAMVQQLLDFQNENLEKDGRDTQDTLICLKPEKTKDDATGKWTNETGRMLLFFKSTSQDKFSVVGPNKYVIDASTIGKGDIVRVNGQAAFGYMQGKPYVTLYLNAVQLVTSGGSGGVAAFDDESDGDDAPFADEDPQSNSFVKELT